MGIYMVPQKDYNGLNVGLNTAIGDQIADSVLTGTPSSLLTFKTLYIAYFFYVAAKNFFNALTEMVNR